MTQKKTTKKVKKSTKLLSWNELKPGDYFYEDHNLYQKESEEEARTCGPGLSMHGTVLGSRSKNAKLFRLMERK